MSAENPVVSILLLSWNHEPYILQCLASIQAQTYRNLELIYLDNKSTDRTYELAQEWLAASGFPYQCFQNETPKKVTENTNALLHRATGDYVLLLSTDDWLYPECVAKKVAYYRTHPQTGMLFSGGTIYFQEEDRFQPVDSSNFKRGRIQKSLLLEEHVIFFIGCCYPRAVLTEVGGWDENLLIEDMDMFLRISMKYDIDYIDEPLVYYRKVNSSAANNINFMVEGWEQYYRKYRHLDWVDMDQWIGEKYRAYAALALDRSDTATARRLLKKAFGKSWLRVKNYQTLGFLLRKMLRLA